MDSSHKHHDWLEPNCTLNIEYHCLVLSMLVCSWIDAVFIEKCVLRLRGARQFSTSRSDRQGWNLKVGMTVCACHPATWDMVTTEEHGAVWHYYVLDSQLNASGQVFCTCFSVVMT